MAKKDKWVRRWKLESFSSSDTFYTVALDREGNYGCSCAAWRFQRKTSPICKHIHHVISLNDRERGELLMRQHNITPLVSAEWKVFVIEDNEEGTMRVGMTRNFRQRE